jgi:DNA-binding transcriptional MerR regulator
MSELARRSGVPAPTIKHYMREGLLPAPEVRTSKSMAYYDPRLVPRIRAIKEAQRSRFLPLSVIREALDASALDAPLDDALLAIERSLKAREATGRRTRAELLAAGMPAEELSFFVSLGAVTPIRDERGDECFTGDDLQLLQTLGAARRAGISPSMLPHTILGSYVQAIGELVRVELELFRNGIVPRAGDDLDAVVDSATQLSERLVILLRRKLLLPMLRELKAKPAPRGPTRHRKPRGEAVNKPSTPAARRKRKTHG